VRGGVRPEALIRFSLLDMQQNQKLRECAPESIYLGLLACAVTGLEPGALHGHAYLVPFGGKAQFMAGYKGLIKMAKRSGEVAGLTSNVVCEADTFDLDLGTANQLVHKPARGDRGEVIGAYAIAKMTAGHHEIEWVDRDDLDKIRAVADKRGKSPAWSEWPTEMMRKTSIRRLSKRLPLGHDYVISTAIEQAQEETGSAAEILDLETDGAASSSEASAARAPAVQVEGFDSSDVQPEDRS
jgi:recombination protein RecT